LDFFDYLTVATECDQLVGKISFQAGIDDAHERIHVGFVTYPGSETRKILSRKGSTVDCKVFASSIATPSNTRPRAENSFSTATRSGISRRAWHAPRTPEIEQHDFAALCREQFPKAFCGDWCGGWHGGAGDRRDRRRRVRSNGLDGCGAR
jgi:hypothetical protein